ncbi:MAG TPA: serine hydrolase [Urbifossiella sp.]|jgi:CubicO group peptidase (beta-lactamase class C family)|nr:serine hydrolase [Urbifossiella sp.]
MTWRVAVAGLVVVAAGGRPVWGAELAAADADRVMTEALRTWAVPGAALAVVRGDEVVVLKGYGHRSLGRPDPVTPDTVFPLASCTKPFTALLLATLADDGRLGWDDAVRRHLPDFRLSVPEADAAVTVRDLLCHRTGVGGNDMLWYHAPWGVDSLVWKIRKLPPEYPFRGGFQYSSLMYMAAGRAAAECGGRPWDVLLKARVTDPLGMRAVAFTSTGIPASADRAGGHQIGKGGGAEPMPAYPMPEANPAGSVHATARDLAAFLRFLVAGGAGPDGKQLVRRETFAELIRPQNTIPLEGSARAMNPDTEQLGYGLGWVVCDHRGKRVVAHGGMIDGFRVQITFLPDEKLGIAVLNNLHETRMNQAVTNSLIDLSCGLSGRDWNGFFRKISADAAAEKRASLATRDKARNPDRPMSYALNRYAGVYEDAAYGPATVTAADGRLVLAWSNFRCPLEHYDGDKFRITEGYHADRLVEFAVNPARGVVALRFIGVVFQKP